LTPFEIDVRSGPSGENPTGTASFQFPGGVISGPVTCLAVDGPLAVFSISDPPAILTFLVFDVDVFEGPGPPVPDSDVIVGDFGQSPSECSRPGFFIDGPVVRGDVAIVDAQPDTLPPILTVPATITVNATSGAGTRVAYTASAIDNVDPSPIVVCTPPSGSMFAIGTTNVSCTATDDTGNKTTQSFNVVVRLPTSKAECKNGGWRNFGTVFKNQGDCVSYVATKGKNPPARPG